MTSDMIAFCSEWTVPDCPKCTGWLEGDEGWTIHYSERGHVGQDHNPFSRRPHLDLVCRTCGYVVQMRTADDRGDEA
jgi:hypothetical protein